MSFFESIASIELKKTYRNARFTAQGYQFDTIKSEMVLPAIAPRIEKWNDFIGF
jgi:hypothetical protein